MPRMRRELNSVNAAKLRIFDRFFFGDGWGLEDLPRRFIPKTVENRTRNGNGKAWQNDFDLENLSWPGNWKS
jgi:hypothetical protein